jgi:hypothetical protein
VVQGGGGHEAGDYRTGAILALLARRGGSLKVRQRSDLWAAAAAS